MLYLLPIPIIFVAVIVKLVSKRYKLKFFNIICNVVIFLGVISFIYLYLVYLGIDILDIIYEFMFTSGSLRLI